MCRTPATRRSNRNILSEMWERAKFAEQLAPSLRGASVSEAG